MKKVVALNASGIAAGAVALLLVAASTATAAVLWHGLADWTPQAGGNPVLESGPPGAWDEHIRERMAVICDNGMYKAWYGGWQGTYNKNVPNQLKMGYATSPDGIHWAKHPTPVYLGQLDRGPLRRQVGRHALHVRRGRKQQQDRGRSAHLR